MHLSPPIKPSSSNEPIGSFEMDENRNLSGQFSSIQKRYGYSELCRHSRISIPLIGLCYCFIAASIISFGFYFYLDFLPGNRYLNMGLMGMFKFLFGKRGIVLDEMINSGLIPYVLSKWCGRKPIAVVALTICMICGWTGVFSILLTSDRHPIVSILSLIVSASIDPVWKVLHLYSAGMLSAF